jgi:hypothetical protein
MIPRLHKEDWGVGPVPMAQLIAVDPQSTKMAKPLSQELSARRNSWRATTAGDPTS